MVRSSSPSVHLLVVLDVDVDDDRTGAFGVRHNIPFQSVSTLEQIRPADRY